MTIKIIQNNIVVYQITITIPNGKTYSDIEWDSATGLVTAKVNDTYREAIPYTGKSFGKLLPMPFYVESEYSNTVKYHYWYY